MNRNQHKEKTKQNKSKANNFFSRNELNYNNNKKQQQV